MAENFPLELPKTHKYAPASISNMYGAAWVAAKYCGLKKAPLILNRHWQHGWVQRHRQLNPEVVAADYLRNKGYLILVARKDEEEYLLGQGHLAKAIGLPFVYTLDQRYERIQSSLLVMPCHTSRFAPINFNENYKIFTNYILEQKKNFRFICVCMHQEDIDFGYGKIWEEIGCEVIRGAAIDDSNSLIRMHALMSQFETILSDAVGSHLVYAAASGAKISLVQPIGREYDNSKDPFFQGERSALRKQLDDIAAMEMDPIRSPYLFSFNEPGEAKQHINWGLDEIGFSNRVNPENLSHLLGWEFPENLLNKLEYTSNVLKIKAKAFFGKI